MATRGIAQVRESGLGRFLQETTGIGGQALKQNPFLYGPYALAGLGYVGSEVVGPIMEGALRGVSDEPRREGAVAFEHDLQLRREGLVQRMRQEQLRRRMLASAARLAAVDPHLYNQILAGRRLPEGARVFGGQPRVDLMEQLAYEMASGQYEQPQPEQDLLAELGLQ